MVNKHLIGKQVVQVEVGASEDTYALQQRISDMVRNKLIPKLDDLFDLFAGEDEVLRLYKVEVDLGVIDINLTNDDWIIEEILRLLEVELRQYRSRIYSKSLFNPQERFQPQSLQSTRHYMFQGWLYWLENGVLPSYAIRPDDHWIMQVLETLAMEQWAVSALRDTLTKSKLALKRLILQHQEKELIAIVELYTGYSQKDLKVFLKEVLEYTKQVAQPQLKMTFRELEIAFWELTLQEVIGKVKKMDSIDVERFFLISLPNHFLRNMEETIKAVPEKYPHLSQIFSSIKSELKKGGKLSESPNEAKENIPEEEGIEGKRLSEKMENVPEKVLAAENRINQGKENMQEEEQAEGNRSIEEMGGSGSDEEMESPQFLNNAGMVLLHPFLHRFFQKLELVEDREFKDINSQCKAVLLLHFLATGNENIPEYELVLPKFLCAMPANLPLDHTIQLTKEEKEEAIGLLEAVIENWGVLGNTSPDGLREGFLIREGKLSRSDPGWKLIVEPRTIDILLDRLPWGISMIKLPWMEDLLKVEWR